MALSQHSRGLCRSCLPGLPTAVFALLCGVCFFAARAVAQTNNPSQKITADSETVVVTGTFQPTPLSELNRTVVSFDTADDKSPDYSSFVDMLTSDSSIDLEQRAPGGVQADLSIRGANFEQSLVLLNGLRMNDAQSGHHDMDLPVSLEAVSRVEVLHGAGSTLYGADAAGGAVNFITTPPVATELRLRMGLGISDSIRSMSPLHSSRKNGLKESPPTEIFPKASFPTGTTVARC